MNEAKTNTRIIKMMRWDLIHHKGDGEREREFELKYEFRRRNQKRDNPYFAPVS